MPEVSHFLEFIWSKFEFVSFGWLLIQFCFDSELLTADSPPIPADSPDTGSVHCFGRF
jgi:hypothetical protein